MKAITSVLALAASLALSACDEHKPAAQDDEGGRYSGVGIFEADQLWKHVKGATSSANASVARLSDDSHIIVVVDRQTGEVRQCGDHSGFCVAMNPWAARMGSQVPALPAELDKHLSDLANESAEAKPPGAKPSPSGK